MTTPASPTIERLPKSRVVCTLIIPAEEVAPAERAALQRLGTNVQIKGFRPGHAPEEALKARVSPEQLFEETIRQLVQKRLPAIADEHRLQPVIPPKIEAVSRDPLTLKITFIERPEVTFKGADNITVEKKEIKADAKDVDRVIQSVLGEHRAVKEVDRAAKDGDQVTADFHAVDEAGAEIQGLRATGYMIMIGSKQLLPGFEEEMIGLKKDDEKTFTLTLPEKFQNEALRGKKATFSAKVTAVQEVTLPTLDDAFAKDTLKTESADAFKKMVEDSIKMQEEQFQRMHRERLLMEEIRNRTKVEIADELLDEEMRTLIQEWSERLQQQGVTMEEALKKEGKTVKQAEDDLRKQAEERWKLRLGMAKLIEERAVTVTDDEMTAAIERFIGDVPAENQAAAKADLRPGTSSYEELRWRTTVEKLIDELLAA